MSIRMIFRALVVVAATLGNAWAQSAPPTVRYALLSAVGDQLTVVYAKMQTGSRLDRNQRDVAALPDNALDRPVLRNLDATFSGHRPAVRVMALAAANASLFSVQRQALMEAADATVRICRGTACGRCRPLDIGVEAPVRGANSCLQRNARNRAPGWRRLHAHRGHATEVCGYGLHRERFSRAFRVCAVGAGRPRRSCHRRERSIEAAASFSMGDSRDALQPWEVLDAEAKVNILDRLLKGEIERALPALPAAK